MAPRTGATRARSEATTRSKRPGSVPRAPRAPLKTPKKAGKPH
jgi:hypothetical protein